MILTSAPTYDTMYFSIPANTYNSNSLSYCVIDRGAQDDIEIKIKEFTSNSTNLKQVSYDGINTKRVKTKFSINSQTAEETLLVSKFFESLLGTQAFTLYNTLTDESNRSIVVKQWNITYSSSLYGDISVDAELVY